MERAGGAYIEIRGDSKKLPSDLKKAHNKIETAAAKMEKRLTQVFQVMGTAAIVGISASLVVLTKKVVALGREFESNMKTVQAWSGATGKSLQGLTNIAREMGATTEYTATKAAGALKFLAAAGFTAKQSIAALPGTLDLATAGQVDLASATDITTDVLTAFGMQVEELNRVSDAFIVTSSSANTNVLMLGESFKMVAPTAKLFNLTVEQTAALLGTLANSGIKAEMAGSGLNMVLMRSAKAAEMLGLDALTPLVEILKKMKEEQWGAVQIGEAFGTRQVKTAAILMNNIEMYEKLTKKILDNAGATSKLAKIIRDSLDIDLKTLNSTIEEELLRTFDKYKDYIREVVQSTTEWIRQNPQAIEQAAELARNLFELVVAIGKVIKLGVEYVNVWVKSAQAMGLASTGIITWRTALIDGTTAVDQFNKGLSAEEFQLLELEKIMARTKDWPGVYTQEAYQNAKQEAEILREIIASRKALAALKTPSKLEEALAAPDKYYGAKIPTDKTTDKTKEKAELLAWQKEKFKCIEDYYKWIEQEAQDNRDFMLEMEDESIRRFKETFDYRLSIWESYNEDWQKLIKGETQFRLDEYAKDLDAYLAVEQAKTGMTDAEMAIRKQLLMDAKKEELGKGYIDELAEAASYYKDLAGFEETYYEKTLELIEARRIAEIDAKKDVAAADAKAFKSQMEALEELIDAKQKGAKTAISAADDMLEASMNLVDKESSAYEAMHEARKVLQIAELAMEAYKNAQIIIGYFARSTAAVATATVQNAANTSTAITGAVASVTAQGSVPIAGFGLAAAMLAFMASVLGMAGIAFGGGSSGASAAPVLPKSTVLGADPGTGSESIQNTYELLKDNHAEEYGALRDIYNEIQDLNQNIIGLVTSIVKGVGGDFGTINTQVEKWLGTAEKLFLGIYEKMHIPLFGALDFINDIVNWVGGFLGKIFGSIFGGGGYVELLSAGIEFGEIDFGKILEGADVFARAFAKLHKHTKGGWFHSDKNEYWTEYKDLDEDVIRLLTQIFRNIGDSFVLLAEGLGVDTQAVYDYIIPIMQLDLKGMSAEEIDKAVNDFFSNLTDKMAEDLFGDIIKQYQKIGEGLYETAIRLVMQKEIILEALKMTGRAFEGTAQEAVAFSQALIEIAGDFETLMDAYTAYHDAFFTDAEKQIQLYEKLTEAFGDLGFELPDTRQGFRALIDGLDLTTKSGMETYVALLKLAEASGIYYDTLEDNIKTIIDAQRELLGTTDIGAIEDIAKRYGLSFDTITKEWTQSIIDAFTKMSTEDVIAWAESLGVSVDTLINDILKLGEYFDLLGNSLREIGRDIRAMLSDISSSFGAPDTAAMLMTQITDLQSIPMAKQTGENLLSMSEKLISWYSAAVAEEQERVRLLNEENRLLEQVVDNVANLVDQIDQVIKSIKYSALNVSLPYQKAEEATEDYWKLYSAAKTGGTEDIQKYIGFVQTYLQQQQAEHKSSQAYQDAYDLVMGSGGHLQEIQGMLEAGSYDQKIYDELKDTHEDIVADLSEIQATFLEFEGWILNALKTLENIQMILKIDWGTFTGTAADALQMLLELVQIYGWENTIVLNWIADFAKWAAQDVERALWIMQQIPAGMWESTAVITFIANLAANLLTFTDAYKVLDYIAGATGWNSLATITFLGNVNMNIFKDINQLAEAAGWIALQSGGWNSKATIAFLKNVAANWQFEDVNQILAAIGWVKQQAGSWTADATITFIAGLMDRYGVPISDIDYWLQQLGITDDVIRRKMEIKLVFDLYTSGNIDVAALADWAYMKAIAAAIAWPDDISGGTNALTSLKNLAKMFGAISAFETGAFIALWSPQASAAGYTPQTGGDALAELYSRFGVTWARGGIVNEPTYGLVGEAGYPEAVIPMMDGYSIPVKWLNGGSNQQNTEHPIDINLTIELDGKPLDIKIKSISSHEADKIRVLAERRNMGSRSIV